MPTMKLINLVPLKEIDFPNQKSFDAYNKKHKMRPDTKVTIAGKKTTAGQAAQKSEPVKGTSVFGKPTGKSNSPREIPKDILSKMDLRAGDDGSEFKYLSSEDEKYVYGIAKEDGHYYVTLGTDDGDIVKNFGKTKNAAKASEIFMKNLDVVKSKFKIEI